MLVLKLITSKKDREIEKRLIEENHSYVPSVNSVGRRIDWLIYLDEELIGMIGIGSSTYPPCKDILTRLGVDKGGYRKIFNNLANNWKFCLMKHIPNIGTQILKELRRESQK